VYEKYGLKDEGTSAEPKDAVLIQGMEFFPKNQVPEIKNGQEYDTQAIEPI